MDTQTQEHRLTGYRSNDIVGCMAQNMDDIIRGAFKKSGMSIKRLSEDTEIPYGAVHRFVTGGGDATLRSANKICKVLGLELRRKKRRKPRG